MKCSGVDLRSKAELEGDRWAHLISGTLRMNPYPIGSQEHTDWVKGFNAGKEALALEFDLWKQSQNK